MGRIWGLLGGPLGGLWGSFWGHLGVFSRVLLARPFRKRFWSRSGALRGGPWGVKMTILIGRGVENQHFRPFALEPISGALQGLSWARFGTPDGAQIAPEALPEPTLKMCFEKDPPQEPQLGPQRLPRPPQDPPNPGPRGPQEGPEGGAKRIKFPTPLQDPLGTPFGTPSGSILALFWGPFWAQLGSHVGPILWLILQLFSEDFSQVSLCFFYGFLQHFFQGAPRLLDSSLVSSRFLYGIF